MQVVDPLHLCPECEVVRTPRSRHCSVCNVCVERFDHHCPWINNCVGIKNHCDFMVFITSLVITIVLTFIGTIAELLEVEGEDLLNMKGLNYDILPPDIVVNKTLYVVLMWMTLVITGFFQLPILLLFYIQAKNFFKNRTTNERFSRKKPIEPKKPQVERAISIDSELDRCDSTGSSLLSAIQQQKLAEDVIKEHGDPEDYTGKSCVCIRHHTAMAFNRKMPSQEAIY